jgi:hypothetical protein
MSNPIDSHLESHLIKIDITGFHEGSMEAKRSMPSFFPASKISIPVRINSCAGHLSLGSDDP